MVFLLGGEVFCEDTAFKNYTSNRFEYEHGVLMAEATARIGALERKLQGIYG